MSAETAPETVRVSTLELFFDLVFVFTITQLTALLADDTDLRRTVEVTVMLALIWWMYGGYAWLTNAMRLDRTLHRLVLLSGMAAFLVIALAVPTALHGDGEVFGVAYVAVVLVHLGLYTRATSQRSVQAILRLAPFNLLTAAAVLAGGIAGGDAQLVLWAVAALVWLTPHIVGVGGFEVAPEHFVERHGLVIIVALGESIVAIGIGAAGAPLDAGLIAIAILGLLLSASLWWTYFGDEEEIEHAMAAAAPARRGTMALDGFGYAHLAMLLGVLAMAVGLKKTTGHGDDALKFAHALALGGGVALFLLATAAFRRVLALPAHRWLVPVAGAATLTTVVGAELAAGAQLTLLVILLATALTLSRPAAAATV